MRIGPLLSIVIPTKDRYYHLIKLIELIESYKLEDLEIIVQDNTADNKPILDFIGNKARPYLKYHYINMAMPISRNLDLGIENSSGQYICVIGDDDGVMPNIIECVKWLKDQKIDAMTSGKLIYNWPDFYLDEKEKSLLGVLQFDQFELFGEFVDPMKSLRQLAKKGFTNIFRIPKIYQGIVKRECLEEVRKIAGSYSPGPSPDMASAVALCFVVKSFVTLQLPVIIVGQSNTVGGGERKLQGVPKRIKEVPFLPKDAEEQWSPRLPKVWCSQTVWPESAIKALKRMGREKEIQIDYEIILARFVQNNKSSFWYGFELSHNNMKYLLYVSILCIGRLINKYKRFFIGILKPNLKNKYLANYFYGFETLSSSVNYLNKNYQEYSSCEAFNAIKIKK